MFVLLTEISVGIEEVCRKCTDYREVYRHIPCSGAWKKKFCSLNLKNVAKIYIFKSISVFFFSLREELVELLHSYCRKKKANAFRKQLPTLVCSWWVVIIKRLNIKDVFKTAKTCISSRKRIRTWQNRFQDKNVFIKYVMCLNI